MSCCGPGPGLERVWVFSRVGYETKEFDSQHEAIKAREAAGNVGVVKRITRRVT